jgi:hypothetical protein
VTITHRSGITDVAASVAMALTRSGVHAVLTGGACATLYSDGAYQSHDLDFILEDSTTRKVVDEAMASIGFTRDGDRYINPQTEFFVEFPRGPLAIGDDLNIRPIRLELPEGSTLALSATDACRDRLAAFYHWSDRQSLQAAIDIAIRQRINFASIKRWSEQEGALPKFDEFRHALARKRADRRKR